MVLLSFVLVMVVLAVLFVKWRLSYWMRRKLPYVATSSIWGNVQNPITREKFLGEFYAEFYNKFKRDGAQHGGFYNMLAPHYLPVDLDVIRNIVENDFDHFHERGFYYNEKDDPISAHLFAVGGEKWKVLRGKVSPTFTRAKIRSMFDIIMQCAKQMSLAMDEFTRKGDPINVKDIMARFTIDVIGSCALGLECNSFEWDKAELFKKCQNILFKYTLFRWLAFNFATNFPDWGRVFGIKVLLNDSSKFFLDVASGTIAYRKTNGIRRNDAFQALIDLGDELTMEEIAAQCLVFFVAGYDTSSSTISYCLYELSRNSDVQARTREEILRVMTQYDGEITYEGIEEMTYLGQVIDETLRKYPPLASFTRTCTKNYQVPNTKFIVEKGTRIVVSVMGIHHDEEYYSNPEKFDPDRFSEENRKKIKPYTYLPFGEGPRMCVGRRFGITEVKVALSILLKDYSFSVNQKVEHPLKWNRLCLTLTSNDIIWLDMKKLSI